MSVLTGDPRGPITRPRPPLVGHRRGETWAVDVLDLQDRYVGPLDGVLGGGLDWSVHATIRTSGDLTVSNPGATDWHRVRLAVRYEYTDEAGQEHVHPLGVFLPTTPRTRHTRFGSSAVVEMYDKMELVATDEAGSTWTADAGTTVADAVAEVLASVGETRYEAPEDGGGTLKAPMVWEPSTPKLRIINDILDAGGFFSIWVDGRGVWRLDPYIPPTARGVAWSHVAGANAIFREETDHEADGWAVPNRVMVVGRTERDEDGNELPAPYAVAENTDPDDPFSIPSRGRVVPVTETDQDATSEAVLGQIAARRLTDLSSVTSTYRIEHAWLPADLNSAHTLVVPDRGVDALCVLQDQSWSWTAGKRPTRVASTLREVKT